MGNFAVYHLEKGSTSSGGIGNHIDRKEGAEHTYRHADPTKKNFNHSFKLNSYCSMPLHQAIEERIKDGYKSPKAIRKDAVKYTTHILTGSHDKMKEIEKNPEQLKSWVEENKKFLEQEFGKNNIVRFVLHRDEKTPHLHAVTVNLTSDGRLSAKEIIGNRKDMQNRQDKYAQAMEAFGLQRGIKSTGIKHENAREYYARIKDVNETAEQTIKLEKNFLGNYKKESLENIQNYVKSQNAVLKLKNIEVEKFQKRIQDLSVSKNKIIDNVRKTNILFDKTLIDDDFRDKIKKIKINELGKKYARDIKQIFAFIPHSIQQKSNEEIAKSIISAVHKVAAEKNLSAPQVDLLLNSKEVNEIYNYVVNEREKRNEIDQNRNRNRSY